MIEYLKYRAKLDKLFRQKEAVRSAFEQDIRKAQMQRQPREDMQSLKYQAYFEEAMLDEEISILATGYLIHKARRRLLPIPPYETEGMWEQCDKISSCSVLTNNGISELRSSLRKDRKERVELVVMILGIFTGVIGAVTGLVAVITK